MAIACVFVIKYIVTSKQNYTNLGDFFSNGKNILASILAVILLVGAPITFGKYMKEVKIEEKARQEQQAILDKEKEAEDMQKDKDKERENALDAKSKLKKLKSDGEDYTNGITLTEFEIEKYKITDAEIEKFNSDVEKAINDLMIKELATEYRFDVRTYVRDNTESSANDISQHRAKHSLNEDRSIFTYRGSYIGTNKYGTRIRGEFEINFDVATGEIIDGFVGNEKVAQ